MVNTLKFRILMKDGKWLVPPEDRPRGWEEASSAAPVPSEAQPPEDSSQESVPDSSIAQTGAASAPPEKQQGPTRKRQRRQGSRDSLTLWRDLDTAVQKDWQWFNGGRDSYREVLFAARVMAAGMWERDAVKLNQMLMGDQPGDHVRTIRRIAERFIASGIWHRTKKWVRLGPMEPNMESVLEFWMNAMVGAGELVGCIWRDGEMRYFLPHKSQASAE